MHSALSHFVTTNLYRRAINITDLGYEGRCPSNHKYNYRMKSVQDSVKGNRWLNVKGICVSNLHECQEACIALFTIAESLPTA